MELVVLCVVSWLLCDMILCLISVGWFLLLGLVVC